MEKIIFWLSILILGICLCIDIYFKSGIAENTFINELNHNTNDEKIRIIITQYAKDHERNLKQQLEDFEININNVGKQQFEHAKQNIQPFVEQVTSFSFCSRLCVYIAADSIRKTTETQDLLFPILKSSIILPCEQGRAEILSALNAFLLQIQENDTQFKSGLADFMKLNDFYVEDMGVQKEFFNSNLQLAEDIQNFAIDEVSAAIGGTMEVLFIRSTYKCIRSATASIVARLSASWTTCGISSAIDGPLPIGDIIGALIAAGGTIWSAYDIYQVTNVLPARLERQISTMSENYHQRLTEKAREQAGKAVRLCIEQCEDFLQVINDNNSNVTSQGK